MTAFFTSTFSRMYCTNVGSAYKLVHINTTNGSVLGLQPCTPAGRGKETRTCRPDNQRNLGFERRVNPSSG
jgi:hypothetical protein